MSDTDAVKDDAFVTIDVNHYNFLSVHVYLTSQIISTVILNKKEIHYIK